MALKRVDGKDNSCRKESNRLLQEQQRGVPENFHNYFVAVFDRDFTSTHTWHGDTLNLNDLEEEGDHSEQFLDSKQKR